MRKHPIAALIGASIPVSLVTSLAWFGVFTFVNGYVIKELGHLNSAWTAATLWFAGGLIGWQLVCTEISAKIGRHATVVLALSVAACAYVGLALTTNLTVICLLLALIGFVSAANNAAWLPMAAEIGATYPGRALAVAQIVSVLCSMAVLAGGGALIAALEYRTAFLLSAGVSAGCALWFYRLTAAFAHHNHGRVVSLLTFTKDDLRSLLRGPFLVVLLLGVCVEPFNYHTINQLFPNLARDAYAVSEQRISEIVALGRLPALAGLLILSRYIDRLPAMRCYGAGLAAAGLVVAGLGRAPDVGWLAAAFVAFYLPHGVVWGSNLAAVNAVVAPRLRDAAFAIMSVVMLGAQFGAGVVHNRMVNAQIALGDIFLWCGAIVVVSGGALLAYSFSAHAAGPPAAPAPSGI